MSRWFDHNTALLKAHHPELVRPGRDDAKTGPRIIKARSGEPTLTVRSTCGRISLHSRFDPVKEAEDSVRRLKLDPGDILIALGLGLGYHLKAALKRLPPETPVAVIEADEQVFDAAMRHVDLSGVINRPGLRLFVGLPQEEALKQVTRMRIKQSFANLALLEHPPSLKSRPDYYAPLKKALTEADSLSLGRRLIYPRLNKESLNILILDTGYYLIREVVQAVQALGHKSRRLKIQERILGRHETIRRLLEDVASFKPDFILTINHLGFDTEGILTGILTRMRLPFASWFVDSPSLILGQSKDNVSDFCSIFVWDPDYIPGLKTIGFERVYYLPLGTDETLFTPINGRPNPLARLACSAGFAGNSMAGPVAEKSHRLGLPPKLPPWLDQAAREFIKTPDRTPGPIMEDPAFMDLPAVRAFSFSELKDLEGLITWRATQIYRQELVQALAPLTPTIIGDQGWKGVLDHQHFKIEPNLSYYGQLPFFYPICRINFNATSRQMKSGLNQRVFDAPACGAFVLTDNQEQMGLHFDLGREAICYREPA
ncbi:MAG: DUF3880 domain-containing protein, partial [Thermodesulfobacteriota bacterium]|nr:DUF3880 domain-containing protein [Thermodesulfobacteriota bacterium]